MDIYILNERKEMELEGTWESQMEGNGIERKVEISKIEGRK